MNDNNNTMIFTYGEYLTNILKLSNIQDKNTITPDEESKKLYEYFISFVGDDNNTWWNDSVENNLNIIDNYLKNKNYSEKENEVYKNSLKILHQLYSEVKIDEKVKENKITRIKELQKRFNTNIDTNDYTNVKL